MKSQTKTLYLVEFKWGTEYRVVLAEECVTDHIYSNVKVFDILKDYCELHLFNQTAGRVCANDMSYREFPREYIHVFDEFYRNNYVH